MNNNNFKTILDDLKNNMIDFVDIDKYKKVVGEDNMDLLASYLTSNGIIVKGAKASDEDSTVYTESDSFKLFLDDMLDYPLISEEKMNEAFIKYNSLTDEKEKIKIRNYIAEGNLRLVVHVAKGYIGRGIEISDLVQEGFGGLLKAVEKYDIATGNKFSTYATIWIKQAMSFAVASKARNIYIPGHMFLSLQKVIKFKKEFYKEKMRFPSNKEISDELNIPIDSVVQAIKYEQDTISLSHPVVKNVRDDSKEYELGNFISDVDAENPETSVEKSDLEDKVKNIIERVLNERQQDIIKMRYGFKPYNKVYSLQEVSDVLGISRERVRQIQNVAESRIKELMSSLLDDYGEDILIRK